MVKPGALGGRPGGDLGRPKGGETCSSWRGLKEVKPGALGGAKGGETWSPKEGNLELSQPKGGETWSSR